MTDLDNICKAIDNKVIKVIEIDGDWGVGKTFTLNKVIENIREKELNSEKSIIEIKYSSLIDGNLKKIIFFEKEGFSDSVKYVSVVAQRASKILAGLLSKVGSETIDEITNYALNKKIDNYNFDNCVIFIDEIERFANNIDFKSFLISIFELKENFDIKIILSLNSSKLDKEDLEIWKRWSDKIIDKKIEFTGIENFKICLDKNEKIIQRKLGVRNVRFNKIPFQKNIRILNKSTFEFLSIVDKFKTASSDVYILNNIYLQFLLNDVYISTTSNNNLDYIYIDYDIFDWFDSEISSVERTLDKKRIGFRDKSDKKLQDLISFFKKNNASFVNIEILKDELKRFFSSNVNALDNKVDVFIKLVRDKGCQFPEIQIEHLFIERELGKKHTESLSIKEKGVDSNSYISKISGVDCEKDYFKYLSENICLVSFGQPTNKKSPDFNIIDIIYNLCDESKINERIKRLLILKIESYENYFCSLENVTSNEYKDIYLINSYFSFVEELDFIRGFLSDNYQESFYLTSTMFKTRSINNLFDDGAYKNINVFNHSEKNELLKNIKELDRFYSFEYMLKIFGIKDINCFFEKFIYLEKDFNSFVKFHTIHKGKINNIDINISLATFLSEKIKVAVSSKDYEMMNKLENLISDIMESSLYHPKKDFIKEEGNQADFEGLYIYLKGIRSTDSYSHQYYLGQYSEDFKDFDKLIASEYNKIISKGDSYEND